MEKMLYLPFSEINVNDPFFDSLKNDYSEFPLWFEKKSRTGDQAYVFFINGNIEGFLYLKIENEALTDVIPALPAKLRLKVGTLKINAHGTKLGERFLKKIFDFAIGYDLSEIYLTVFSKHEGLLYLLRAYGFEQIGEKNTANGSELVMRRCLFFRDDVNELRNYPFIDFRTSNAYLLALRPQWHSRLLPDSKLSTESIDIIRDISPTNSIHKVYLAKMMGMERLKKGDILVIYRTNHGLGGSAEYHSVATSLCVVEEYKDIRSFYTMEEFLTYCSPYSIFTDEELKNFWKTKKYFHIVKLSYNIALKKRPIRKLLADVVGISRSAYWGFIPLTKKQVHEIAKLGEINENIIID